MYIRKLNSRTSIPNDAKSQIILQADNWDDFGFKTLFSLTIFDSESNRYDVGSVKIGFFGQKEGATAESIESHFEQLPESFFSLGQDADYYKALMEEVPQELAQYTLTALRDVIYYPELLKHVESEDSFNTSLMRMVNHSTISNQFQRIIKGDAALSEYDFSYKQAASGGFSAVELSFQVEPKSMPSSNVHILIGRNGVGKTTLINNMLSSLLAREEDEAKIPGAFYSNGNFLPLETKLDEDYFAGVVSVSFSAFDAFEPPEDQQSSSGGMRYKYIGLQKTNKDSNAETRSLKTKNELASDFVISLDRCLSLSAKEARWLEAIKKLESDLNFEEMQLNQLVDLYKQDRTRFNQQAYSIFHRMSSGHSIVLLTMTKLVESVEEKTIVFLDEPESHLHPPLLSAFTRALSDLLLNRNGVAIVATHSPVVLQEVPQLCVSVIRRKRGIFDISRPEIETFAENVGRLTRDVFGLEVSKSGYLELFNSLVSKGQSYEQIETSFNGQIGFEGKALLRSLINSRDKN